MHAQSLWMNAISSAARTSTSWLNVYSNGEVFYSWQGLTSTLSHRVRLALLSQNSRGFRKYGRVVRLSYSIHLSHARHRVANEKVYCPYRDGYFRGSLPRLILSAVSLITARYAMLAARSGAHCMCATRSCNLTQCSHQPQVRQCDAQRVKLVLKKTSL